MPTIHSRLNDLLEGELSGCLSEPPQFPYDGLKAKLKDGTELSLIYPDELLYIFKWEKEGVAYSIDTAPVHKGLGTSPNHFHNGDGEPIADPVTDTKRSPEENLKAVIKFILGE